MALGSKSAGQMPKLSQFDWAQAAVDMAQANSENLLELARAAHLDPWCGDLADIDLSGLDLSGQDLSGWDLRYAVFDNATLRRTDLTGTKLTPANLIKAKDWRSA